MLDLEPAHAEKLERLKEALFKWQLEIGDIGLIPESEITAREGDAGALRRGRRRVGGRASRRDALGLRRRPRAVQQRRRGGRSAAADLGAARRGVGLGDAGGQGHQLHSGLRREKPPN